MPFMAPLLIFLFYNHIITDHAEHTKKQTKQKPHFFFPCSVFF